MKILHTADWHLGVKTDRRPRIEEQRKIMQEIVDYANNYKVDIVLVSGDVFDQAVPTSEAEELFYDTLEKLSANNNRVVVVLAGNHDDPKRLSANKHFAKKHNVVLVGDLNPICELNLQGKSKVVEVGEGYIVVQVETTRGSELVSIGILPYPAEYRLNAKAVGSTYQEQVKNWSRLVCKGFKRNSFNILASHLMVAGAKWEEDGNIMDLRVGDINVVSPADLPKADYYALGHIHTNSVIKNNIVYSGAPIKLSYNQSEPGVVLLTAGDGKLKDMHFHRLTSPVKMEQVCAVGLEKVEDALKEFNENDIVELTIVQDKPLSTIQIKEIKEKYPCVLTVKLELTNIEVDDKTYVVNRDKLTAQDLFINFYKQKKQVEPSKEILKLFVDVMEDKASETN